MTSLQGAKGATWSEVVSVPRHRKGIEYVYSVMWYTVCSNRLDGKTTK